MKSSAPDLRPRERDTPFFIVGTGRCGTTLLQAMLSCHPRLCIPPETRYFGRRDPAVRYSDPLEDGQVASYLDECRNDLWWRQLGVSVDCLEKEIAAGMRSSREIFLWLLSRITPAEAARIGEKSPPHGLHVGRILQLFPGAKFVHVYRDPRDVVASYLKQYWCTDRTGIHVALYCRHFLRTIEKQAHHYGDQAVMSLRYEDLVRDPEPELRKLCSFLNEDFDPAMLDFDRREHTGFLAIEQPWKGLTRKPLTESRVGAFRHALTPRQVFLIERILQKELPQFGYEPARVGRWRPDWLLWYFVRRLHRRVIRRLGLVRPLLDEQKVLEWADRHADPQPARVESSCP